MTVTQGVSLYGYCNVGVPSTVTRQVIAIPHRSAYENIHLSRCASLRDR